METSALKERFKEFRVLTLDQVSKLHGCSIRTVQRQFAALDVLRSYNRNSRYYTLPDIPKFNTYGIWEYQDVRFSKFGDLRKTVKQLILNSGCGLSGSEIGDIVGLLPRSFMHHFREMDGIFREKASGVYIYFSDDPSLYARQNSKRNQVSSIKKISNALAVQLLIAYIKYPELSEKELSDTLARDSSCAISPEMITDFLSFHELLKKTPDS
ncbi:MAG: hypothetical protein HN580_16610 [Deltaproteobacteria bacterium]|jgi:hypothetical protein|nr:hypothetical protein [Deltaproteobacteria bacterium]MBT4267621.1 hypothetical protein [Deltaproteobacteria bacterium]MBT7712373.1 hypothetical protein [Deltaproteobacteria bacterium]MBT7890641.1 hypothetical protein [Deltaproteobacteria bacterium]